MRRFTTLIAGLFAALLVSALGTSGARAAQATAQSVVQTAAQAMGGADRIRSVRNITLNGYGIQVYQMGNGRITGELEAPEKYIQQNDLQRVYDLQNGRMRMQHRTNNQFPFLGSNAHAWNQTVQFLDGDIAYNRQGERLVRAGGGNDAVIQRRIWLYNNPAALVRAMMDPAAKLSAPRSEGQGPRLVTAIDVVLPKGDKFTVAFRGDGLPAWIRWVQPQTNFGQMAFTTHFTGWVEAQGNSGLKLPLGYVTRMDYRNVDFLKIYVDAYQVDTDIPNLAIPDDVRNAPPAAGPGGQQAGGVPTITSKPIGKGIWRVDQGGTMVIEFKDHFAIYELNINVNTSKAVIAHARTLVPGKPLRYYISSHNHQDHTQGLRQAVAEGATVVQRAGSESQFREMAEHRAPDYPDDQERNRRPFKFLEVKDHLRMSDETQTIDIYAVPENGHMADAIVIYIPSEKMLMEGDLVSASLELQHWPDGFRDVIAKYKLDVEWVAPVHPDALQPGQGKYTKAYVEDFLKAGTDRARAHCKLWLDRSVYHAGCPIQSKYY